MQPDNYNLQVNPYDQQGSKHNSELGHKKPLAFDYKEGIHNFVMCLML